MKDSSCRNLSIRDKKEKGVYSSLKVEYSSLKVMNPYLNVFDPKRVLLASDGINSYLNKFALRWLREGGSMYPEAKPQLFCRLHYENTVSSSSSGGLL